MKKIITALIIMTVISSCEKRAVPTLFMIGDSTMADKPLEDNPERGWGQLLPEFFDTTSIKIENHARNGRSTRSFIYESRWDTVYSRMKEGDFIIIQFGHNDGSVEKTGRYATPEEYRYNLVKFVKESQSKGVYPVLCTPVVRRKFDEKGVLTDTHGEYPNIVRSISDSLNIPLIDMQKESEKLVSSLGDEGSKKLYLHIAPGIYIRFPEGKKDDTHFSEEGARTIAAIAVKSFREKGIPLTQYLKDEK